MYRRNVTRLLPSAIPRDAWDPAHHNSEWHDSYSEHITKRRDWPTRKWLIGLVPKTPREYLEYSHRNLAYQYNARMRACTTFPEMVPYYKEMLTRGIKIDVDTMCTVLTRAARFSMITPAQIFDLCDEMCRAGAKMDLTVVEVLHTVYASVPPNTLPLSDTVRSRNSEQGLQAPSEADSMNTWKSTKRSFLIQMYNELLKEEIQRLGSRRLFALLLKIFAKYRANLRSLHAGPSYENYAAYISFSQNLVPQNDTWYDRMEPTALASVLTTLEALKQDIYDSYVAIIASSSTTPLEYVLKPRHAATATNIPKTNNQKNDDTLLSLESVIAHANTHSSPNADFDIYATHDMHDGFSQIYLSAIHNAVMRYGGDEGQATLLYFLNALFQNLRKDGVKPNQDVWRDLADIGKYTNRTIFLRNIVRECCRGQRFEKDGRPKKGDLPADIRVLSRYVCTVDPWSSGTVNPFVGQTASNATRLAVENRRTAQRALKRYQETRDFLHNAVQLGELKTPEERAHAQEAVTALLWFTQKLVRNDMPMGQSGENEGDDAETLDMRVRDKQAVVHVCVQILEDISNIHSGMMEEYSLGTIDGEYVDQMSHLIDMLSKELLDNKSTRLSTAEIPKAGSSNPLENSKEEALTTLAKIHHELLEKIRNDPTTRLAWAEIA